MFIDRGKMLKEALLGERGKTGETKKKTWV